MGNRKVVGVWDVSYYEVFILNFRILGLFLSERENNFILF